VIPLPELREHVPLSGLTTIGLGGTARFLADCREPAELAPLYAHAKHHALPFMALGGGSNVVFPDTGFGGLIVRIRITGSTVTASGTDIFIRVGAGEEWDPFVAQCVEQGFAGLECLSGIPGFVGATPIQNVGAYGQEVSETIRVVEAFDTQNGAFVEFAGDECGFRYRQSRFKQEDRGRYIISAVTFRLTKDGSPAIRYAELERQLEVSRDPGLGEVRSAVISLRRRKSMVIDPSDPNSRSVGSFFMNPVLPRARYASLAQRWTDEGNTNPVPSFPDGNLVKIPAAWLVEHAGFSRGLRRGGVGISANHALALVNLGATTSELLAFADEISRAVYTRFSVRLEPEPHIVS